MILKMPLADSEGGGGGRGYGLPSPLGNHKLLYVSLEILVRTLLEKQLDPIASRGRSVWPPVIYVDE